MSRYAERTSVSSDKSRAEIEQTLRRYGADAFGYGWDGSRAVISFRADNRTIRFLLPLPDPNSREFTHTPVSKERRSDANREAAYEQAVRQRWRALALCIKAKLEAVQAGIVDFESEFLAHIVLPQGHTVGEWLRPQLDNAYESGTMPSLLPGVGPAALTLPSSNGAVEAEVVDS